MRHLQYRREELAKSLTHGAGVMASVVGSAAASSPVALQPWLFPPLSLYYPMAIEALMVEEAGMPREFSDELLELVAVRMKVLAEPMRLKLLNALRGGEKSVTELVEETETSQANVSKHLGLLLRNRMVARRKEGLNVFYRIADPTIFELCELICNGLEAELDFRRQALEGGSVKS